MILFENLFKPRHRRLAVDMLMTLSVLSATSKQCFKLTSSVSSTTSKHCFEQPAANFLVYPLIFIEYDFSGCQFSLDKGRVGRGVVPPSPHT
ncbi:S1 RNA-binding domain-containing protein [Streptococcus pneumoniae]|nr:S1 RNA-binding domain-containing protein [Streptococcus pneumoniae]